MTESQPDRSLPNRSLPARPPLWVTLILGAVVGYGFGTAWDHIAAGVGLGLVLAILAQRIFR